MSIQLDDTATAQLDDLLRRFPLHNIVESLSRLCWKRHEEQVTNIVEYAEVGGAMRDWHIASRILNRVTMTLYDL